MKRFLITAALAFSSLTTATIALAHDADGNHTLTGVLIDNACGAKQKSADAAKDHPVACTLKEACAASGYQFIVGDKHWKLSEAGSAKVKAYLEKAESTRATVVGKVDGDAIEVVSIKPAAAHPEPKK